MTSGGDFSTVLLLFLVTVGFTFMLFVKEHEDNKMFDTHFKVTDICPILIQSIAAGGGHLLTISTLLPKAGLQLPFRIQDSYLIHLC